MKSPYVLRGICAAWIASWGLGGPAVAQVGKMAPVSVTDFGAKGDGVTDDRLAIQAAIDSVTAGAVYLPPAAGGYLITPNADKNRFLTLKPTVQLIGIGNPVIRVAKYSAPYDYVIAASSCDDCAIRGLTIDSNISGNPVKDQAELHAHPRIEIAFFAGQRIKVEDVTIKNSSAENSIVSGVVSDITITHCTFTGNGDDPNHTSHDHSALYIGADGGIIDSNTFTAVRRGAPAAITAIETHGSGISIRGNVITDYAIGMNVTGVAASDSVGIAVSGNTIRGALKGIQIWSNTYKVHSTGYGVNGISVTGNTVVLNQTSYAAGGAAGIIVEANSNLPVANAIISGNVVVFDLEDTPRLASAASMGIGWWSALGQSAENFIIADNLIDNAPIAGIRLAGVLRGCRVSGNIIRNAGSSVDNAIAPNYKTPIFIAGAPLAGVDIADNQIIDTLQPSRIRTALLLATNRGTSSGLRIRNNSVLVLSPNRQSFQSYMQILDDRTRPLLIAAWDDFTAPTKKVAFGSEVTDSKNCVSWRAGSDGYMLPLR